VSSQPQHSFLVLDLETTSKWSSHARIVEYAVVTFTQQPSQDFAVSATHTSRVDPGEPIPREASAIHGIYDHDVVSAPSTRQALPMLLSALQNQIVVGYNIVEYDIPCLAVECRRHGLIDEFTATMSSLCGLVDVMPWAARTSSAPQYRKGARTLATMSHRHGVVLESAHTASDDAEACGWLMLSLMRSGAMPAELGDVVEATRPTRR
jgi:DNA polymerase III epsilon subunit-like protein